MTKLYFAYGSNLALARLRERAPSARPREPALLHGRALTLDKRGRDGSGKANLSRRPGAGVWGALYEIDAPDWPGLDGCEPGYARLAVEVVTASGRSVAAETYVGVVLTADPVPFDWYKRLLVEGARERGLPAAWVALLEALPERPDPRLSAGAGPGPGRRP